MAAQKNNVRLMDGNELARMGKARQASGDETSVDRSSNSTKPTHKAPPTNPPRIALELTVSPVSIPIWFPLDNANAITCR